MKKIKYFLISFGIIGIVSFILLAAASLVISKMQILPKASLQVLTTIIGSVAVFLGGLLASAFIKEKGLLCGAVCGAAFILSIGLITFILYQSEFNLGSVGKLAAILISGCIGGILGVNRKKKVKF